MSLKMCLIVGNLQKTFHFTKNQTTCFYLQSLLGTRKQIQSQPTICPFAFSLGILESGWHTRHWAVPCVLLSLCHTELILAAGSSDRKPGISYQLGFLYKVMKISVVFYHSELRSSRIPGTSATTLITASLAYSASTTVKSYSAHCF